MDEGIDFLKLIPGNKINFLKYLFPVYD